ncbi:MAG: hypothetical protein L7F78_13335, partial [Syntrophales bacterium LBB04]|nr:hypothetical protein [Syntrophales bacterium LBB04]
MTRKTDATVQGSINLSEDELRALLYLPFFRAPNQLSPFFKQQSQEAWANCEPQEGLSLLEQKGLWDSAQKELTLEGRKRFVPLFSPTARVMLFSGAYSRVPFEEYYSFKKYTVQYSDYSGLTVSSPMDEQQLVDHLRKIFSDRHPPITENRLSLFEEEFILLLLTVSLQEEGISVDIQSLFQRIRESIEAKGLAFPILGWVGTEGQIPPMLAMESLK